MVNYFVPLVILVSKACCMHVVWIIDLARYRVSSLWLIDRPGCSLISFVYFEQNLLPVSNGGALVRIRPTEDVVLI